MEASDLINVLIYHLSDTDNDYHVRLLVDETEHEFEVKLDDGNIRLVATN